MSRWSHGRAGLAGAGGALILLVLILLNASVSKLEAA
jgi:hypothetical protein